MRPKRPCRASLDQLRISRRGKEAIIEYVETGVWTTHLNPSRRFRGMTDQEER